MKSPRSVGQLLTVALALAPLASAWSNWLPDIDALVVRRQDDTNTAEPTATTPSDQETPTETSKSGPTTTNLNTGGITKTDDSDTKTTDTDSKATDTKTTDTDSEATDTETTGTKESETKSRTFDPIDGAGSVVMATPAITDGSTFYKIENPTPITWVWNYTKVQADPTAIDVLVSVSNTNVKATWTLTQNMTFEEPQATFTWDTLKYQTEHVEKKLITEKYTLVIYDSDGNPTSNAEAGYLAPFNGFQFGLYTTLPYHNLSEWDCVTCSAASGDLDRKAIGFAVSMSAITILSFTWYVVGFAGLL